MPTPIEVKPWFKLARSVVEFYPGPLANYVSGAVEKLDIHIQGQQNAQEAREWLQQGSLLICAGPHTRTLDLPILVDALEKTGINNNNGNQGILPTSAKFFYFKEVPTMHLKTSLALFSYLAEKQLFALPVIQYYMQHEVDKDITTSLNFNAHRTSKREAKKVGGKILIFPEGTRAETGYIIRPHTDMLGPIMNGKTNGVLPIKALPILFSGIDQVQPRNSSRTSQLNPNHPVTITFGKPLAFQQIIDHTSTIGWTPEAMALHNLNSPQVTPTDYIMLQLVSLQQKSRYHPTEPYNPTNFLVKKFV